METSNYDRTFILNLIGHYRWNKIKKWFFQMWKYDHIFFHLIMEIDLSLYVRMYVGISSRNGTLA